MRQDFINTGILAVSFLSVFGIAEIMYHYLKIAAEYTRKFVHIASGLITLLFPVLIGNQWLVLLLCACFAMILIGSITFGLLPSINAVGRHTIGSLVYPAAVYGCYLVYNYESKYIYFYLPIVIMAISDPAAAIMGKYFGWQKYTFGGEQKSLSGSLAFFVSAGILSLAFLVSFTHLPLMQSLIYGTAIAFAGAVMEGLSRKGIDNITVPAIIILVMRFIFGI